MCSKGNVIVQLGFELAYDLTSKEALPKKSALNIFLTKVRTPTMDTDERQPSHKTSILIRSSFNLMYIGIHIKYQLEY